MILSYQRQGEQNAILGIIFYKLITGLLSIRFFIRSYKNQIICFFFYHSRRSFFLPLLFFSYMRSEVLHFSYYSSFMC